MKPVPAPLDGFPAGPEALPDAAAVPRPSTRVPPSGPQATALAASSGHLPRMTSSGLAVMAADSNGSLRSSASYRAPVERHGWPFYAVIGGAALVGSIAVLLAMRWGSTASDATSAPGAASLAVRKADSAATLPSSTGSLTVSPIEQAPDPAATAPPGDPPKASRPTRAAAPPRTASTAPPAAAPAQPMTKREHDDELNRSYAAGLYDKVVEQCGAGPLSAEHAPLCFLAACHAGNEARARKWIAAVPSSKREQLLANCKQVGLDIKKPDKPVDCEADPMACQH
jgi:hypothetical protein